MGVDGTHRTCGGGVATGTFNECDEVTWFDEATGFVMLLSTFCGVDSLIAAACKVGGFVWSTFFDGVSVGLCFSADEE